MLQYDFGKYLFQAVVNFVFCYLFPVLSQGNTIPYTVLEFNLIHKK